MLRASGMAWDLRIIEDYDNYRHFKFLIPIGQNGDCYDRYLIRIEEMRESLKIIKQAINYLQIFEKLDDFSYCIDDSKIMQTSRYAMKYSMESLIHHFKYYTEGIYIPKEEYYSIVEAPKGEFGLFIVSNNSTRPYRCRIKAPGFLHLQALNVMTINTYLADLVTIIGSQDLVFGEIDR